MQYIDDIAVMQVFDDDNEATRGLVRATNNILVYHTGREKIEVPTKRIFGFRGAL